MRTEMPLWRHGLRGVLLLSLLTACGQTNGCAGCDEQGAAPPFPGKDKVHSAVQVRVSRGGVEFLEQNLEPLLAEALPDNGLSVCLPGDGGDIIGLVEWGYCQDEMCPEGGAGCNLDIAIGEVDLEARPPNEIRASVTFGDLSARIPIQADPVVDCALTIDGAGFTVGLPLILSAPEPTRELTFAIAGAPEYQLSALDIGLSNDGGFLGFLCGAIDGVINFPFIGDLILDALQGVVDGLLVDQISGLFEGFTCRTCEMDQACAVSPGAACVEGVCRNPDESCVPASLGVEGLLDVGSLLSGFSPGLEASVAYHAVPGSYVAVENGGISLGMISGAISDRSRCVPAIPQPEVYEPLRTDLMRGNIDLNENPFAVGIGVTEEIVGHFMWAAFNSGALCLEITTDAVEQLNVGTLSIALPGLGDLARNRSAPIGITMSPQQLPRVRIGANTFEDDDEGNRELADPLLTIELDELWLDFHVFMDDRWVRIFSLHTDVSIPFGLEFDPDNGLIPVLGDIASGIGNLRAENGEVMVDDPAFLAGLLPVILNAFVGDLASGLAEPIELPDIMGFQLDLQDGAVTGIEDNTMLAIFAGLRAAPAPEEMVMVRLPVDTAVEVLEVGIPPTEAFAIRDADSWRAPFVRLGLDAWQPGLDDAPMEFSWKVDNGSWTAFSPAREVTVRHPMFALQAKHTIQVRARRVDDYRTLDPSPAAVEVVIDSVAPTLEVRPDGDRWRLVADDRVSGPEGLRFEARWDEGPWTELDEPAVHVDGATKSVEVRAVDEAGNATEARIGVSQKALIGRPDPSAPISADGGCGGCAVGGEPSGADAPWWLLGGLLLFFGVGRRGARRVSPVLIAGLVLVVGGLLIGCDDEAASKPEPQADMGGTPPPECTADDGCPDGEICRDGACVALTCADDPAVCDALDCGNRGSTCNAGTCECLPFCPEGCADGAFCCEARNACEMPPAATCAAAECPPGFATAVVDEGTVDGATCERVDVACDCVELDPLDPGFVGRFVDLTVHDRTAWISAYAEDYGDLVVARYDEVAGWVWQWVDGVPEGEIEGAPSGPRGGVEADGPDVGQYTSIAAAADGALHIAYRDVDNAALKYAHGAPRGDGTHDWTTITVDADDAGRWASLSLGPDGVPAIAYRVGSVAEGEGFVSQLRVRVAAGAAPTDPADWGEPYVVQTRALPQQDPETGSYPEGTGLFNSLTRGPDGRLQLAWYDRTEGRLWWSTLMDAGWSAPEMLAGWGHPDPDRDGDMGANVDLFVDGEGNPHLCYQDGMTDSLRYLAPTLDRDEWVDDGVWLDVGGRGYAVHVVGDDCNVRLDGAGEPVIVFQDATLQALLMRRRTRPVDDPMVESPWSRREVLRGDEADYAGAHGFYASAAVVDGELWVVHYVYNNQVSPAVRRIELVVEPL